MKTLYCLLAVLTCSLPLFGADCETRYVYGGLPKIIRTLTNDQITIVTNCGYVVGYSEKRRNPLWVAYRLKKVGRPGEKASNPERQNRFRVDPRTISRVKDADYTNTGYDRGHMAPSYGIGSRYGADAQDETFFMSNMCPQLHKLNGGTWKNLESCEADDFANAFEEVWIIDGPIFNASSRSLTSGVLVPSQFYKIIIDELNGKPRVLGFVMDHGIPSTKAFDQYLMNVKAIQLLAGVEFFPGLPTTARAKLENSKPRRLWKVPKS